MLCNKEWKGTLDHLDQYPHSGNCKVLLIMQVINCKLKTQSQIKVPFTPPY